MSTHALRLKYEAAVVALGDAASQLLRSGASEEHVARWAVAERNALKEEYRKLTPALVVARIAAKTLERYGNTMGPSADDLRAVGKSWREIIDSATRPGDHGTAFFLR
ncbi:hemagglutinin [Variovorax sp. E3]|uniref:hemagglutinin n=1 Tax=Variovorax sp. E3 TaxID=1914993 RepID=UPI0018DB210A|nr:hemagglutinin [Variovorax sp. E3]